MMPRSLGMAVSMIISGRLVSKINPRFMIVGALTALGFSQHLLTGFDLQMDSRLVILGGTLQGLSMGFIVTPLTIIAYSTMSPKLRTDGTAVFSMCRNLSASVAIRLWARSSRT